MIKKNHITTTTNKPNRLTLNLAIATALVAGYGGKKVYAGSCVGSAGTYTCSGAANPADITQQLNGSNLSVTTTPGFGIDTSVSGGEALALYAPTGPGNVIFTDTNSSIITGNSTAININNYNDGYLTLLTNGTLTSNTD